MLTQVAPDLWEYDAPMTIIGMALGHRMTVAKLPDGTLWLHSPSACLPALTVELAELGPVAHVVAPNAMHDTYLEGWFADYPDAGFHGAKGFSHFRPDLKFTDTLGETAPAAWSSVFDQLVLRGMPRLNEVVFLHRASRTLIVTDLVFNLGADMPFLSRVLLKINGCDNCLAVSRLLRTTIKDRAALRVSLDQMLTWDFDRVIVSHGRNLDSGAKDSLRTALAFI